MEKIRVIIDGQEIPCNKVQVIMESSVGGKIDFRAGISEDGGPWMSHAVYDKDGELRFSQESG